MHVYKMILRDGENPETSNLHVVEKYCKAANRNEAAVKFNEKLGPKWVVAGPLLVEEGKVPTDASFID